MLAQALDTLQARSVHLCCCTSSSYPSTHVGATLAPSVTIRVHQTRTPAVAAPTCALHVPVCARTLLPPLVSIPPKLTQVIPPSDAKVFQDYVLPSLSLLPNDPEEAVRVEYAAGGVACTTAAPLAWCAFGVTGLAPA